MEVGFCEGKRTLLRNVRWSSNCWHRKLKCEMLDLAIWSQKDDKNIDSPTMNRVPGWHPQTTVSTTDPREPQNRYRPMGYE